MSLALSIKELHKSYGELQVLRGLSLDVESGQRVLLLGANGSGKSTLLRISSGLCEPDRGQVSRNEKLSYLGHSAQLYGRLSVRENLSFFAALSEGKINVEEASEEWDLLPLLDRPVCELSKGTLLRVALAKSFLCCRPFLLLDEPSSALDDQRVEFLCKKLSAVGALIATHDLNRLRGIADRVLWLNNGEVAADSGQSGFEVEEVIELYRRGNR